MVEISPVVKFRCLGAGVVMNNRSFAPLTLRSVAFRVRSLTIWLSGSKLPRALSFASFLLFITDSRPRFCSEVVVISILYLYD